MWINIKKQIIITILNLSLWSQEWFKNNNKKKYINEGIININKNKKVTTYQKRGHPPVVCPKLVYQPVV